MLVTWKYRPHGWLVRRFNARARLIFAGSVLLAVIPLWDARLLAGLCALALVQFLAAKIGFRETRRFWALLAVLLLFLHLMTLLTGRGGPASPESAAVESRIVARLPAVRIGDLRWQPALTAGQAAFVLAQTLRILTMALLAIVLPYTVDPALYGVIFRGLGMPDRFAVAADLAFRFVPSLAADFAMTVDAQKARGYELERVPGGPLGRARRLAPLIVPVTINAIVNGEEVVDVMELRGFGTRRRTWYDEIVETSGDRALIALGVGILAVSVGIWWQGYGGLWVPAP